MADKSVLIVDDSAIMRETVADYCIDLDYEPVAVASGAEAVEAVGKQDFSLVFLDVHMPGMDGMDTLEVLLKHKPGLKVVFMTTDRGEELFEQTTSAGFPVRGFINKPFDLGVFRVCLRTVLELGGIFRHKKEGYR